MNRGTGKTAKQLLDDMDAKWAQVKYDPAYLDAIFNVDNKKGSS